MKNLRSLTSLFAAGAVLALGALATPSASSPAAVETRQEEFERKFAEAMKINDRDEMAKVVKTYQHEAVVYADVLCSTIPQGTSDELERKIAALTKAWQSALDTNFVEHHYTYLSLIAPATNRERDRLRDAYRSQRAKFTENQQGDRSGPVFEVVAGELKAIGQAFEEVGDNYLAGEAWMFYGLANNEDNRGKDVDKRRVVEGYGRMIELWDSIGLHYLQYYDIKRNYDALILEGWGATLNDPDAPAPDEPVAAEEAAAIALTFEVIEELDTYERPNYCADEMYQMWPSIFLQGKGASATFATMKQGPMITREASSVLTVDFDRDGTGEAEIKLTGRKEVVVCDLIDDGPARQWAFVTATGIQEDNFQGMKVNLQPDDTQMSLYYLNAGSMTGMIGETPIRVLDDNMDGIYGSPPVELAYDGLSPETFQPELDSVVIGESKRALPWSELMKVGEQWMRLESINMGIGLAATPMEVKTGTLKLDYKGPPVTWMIVRGNGDALDGSLFDLMANGKKGVEVPVGQYSLYVGQVLKGKKQQAMKALVLPGTNTPTWTVKEGEETVVELGAPFGFVFSHSKGEEVVTVEGRSVTIVGSGDERYERTWKCSPRPEASARKAGSRKGGKEEKMNFVASLDEIRDGKHVFSQSDTWRPLDTEIEIKKSDEAVEVQLVEKKNKLFGKIESEWL